jgi:1-acyl-sn-glycerol-3-phosphate acyltransferase
VGGPLPLYDLAGIGLWVYVRAAFDVRVLGREHLRLRPRTLIVVTHRSDADVPVFAHCLYPPHASPRRRALLPHFAVRDDLFLRGFFAGYPPWRHSLPRRLAWPLGVGPALRRLRCHPIASARELRLVQVFRAAPERTVEELAPPSAMAALEARAVGGATRAGDALVGRAADVLWRTYGPEELDREAHRPLWAARRREALRDFRGLVDAVSGSGTVVLFPEGRPSPDGTLGPIRAGLGALVRRARPERLLALALAYDPLVSGRTRVHVAAAEPVAPPADDVDAAVLDLMRTTMPLTAGQLAARARLDGRPLDAPAEVDAALAEGRPVERDLLDPGTRRRRLDEALAAPAEEATLRRLAREYESARAREAARAPLAVR